MNNELAYAVSLLINTDSHATHLWRKMGVRIHQCLIWTIFVNCMLVYADIGGVHVGIRYQLHRCLCHSYSLPSCLTQQQACLQSSIFRCLLFHKPLAKHLAEIRPLCGVINTGNQLKANTWRIAVPSTFSLYINFLHFYLPMSPNCKFGTRVLLKVINKDSEPPVYTYCGHRVPWDISFLLSRVIINCNKEYDTPPGFYFVVTFQAFDSTLPSIALTQVNEYEELKIVNTSDSSVLKSWWSKYDKRFTFAYLSIGQDRSFIELEVQLHIIVLVIYRISLQSSLYIFSQMTVYDGPGILSPRILFGKNTTTLYLSSYQGFVRYSGMVNGKIATAYTHANKHSHLNMTSLAWDSEDWFDECVESRLLFRNHTHIRSHFGCSFISYGTITIHQMKFSGFNMVRYSSSITDVTSSCQYGGLFVLKHSNGDQYLKICTDVKKRLIIPITVITDGDARGVNTYSSLVVAFITFPGYSTGVIEMTSEPDQDCYGTNVAISRGPSCNNYITLWEDSGQVFHDIHDYKIKQCTNVWLMNDIDYFESSPFENCHFVLDHAQLPHLVGPLKMITSAFNSATYYDRVAVSLQTNATFGNMNVEMDIFEEPHIKTSSTKVNFTVSLFKENEYSIKSAVSTVFLTNFSFHEQFPLFTIRIQFTGIIICSRNLKDRTTRRRLSKLLRIQNSTDIETYLPRDHPFQEIAKAKHFAGYNRGTCRILVVGQACSSFLSHYKIIRIHYSPHKSLLPRHEIDISMKKTMNCSIKYALNVGVMEYIVINNTQRLMYHEWRRIYRVTWQISAKSRGFSVIINSTCETCTTLCDVAVAMGFPLRHKLATHKENKYYTYLTVLGSNILTTPFWLDLLSVYTLEKLELYLDFGTFENILFNITNTLHGISLQNAMYGNWHDAHTYCMSRNSSLFTLTPSLAGQLKMFIDSTYLEHKWKYPHYFAGLHRDNSVGTHANTFQEQCLRYVEKFNLIS